MTERGRRLAAWLGVVAMHLTALSPAARAADLPTGFGPLSLGMPWSEARTAGTFNELGRAVTAWEQHVHDCGYRSARFSLEHGNVLVITQDHVVTSLSHATALEPARHPMQAAALVVEAYGQPRQTTLRDRWGAVTAEPDNASHVLLEYQGNVDASFAFSSAPVREARTTLSDRDRRRLENQTIRCARERDRTAPAEPRRR